MLKYLLTIAVIWLVYRQIKQSSPAIDKGSSSPIQDLPVKEKKREKAEYIDYEDVE